nr:hypothetical protein GCM10025699_25690 [Microbacterium flavescens]
MPKKLHVSTAVAAALTALVLLLAGCAPGNADGDGSGETASTQDDGSAHGGGQEGEEGEADGGEDPAQEPVRTGPVADYGGPAYGDQGEAEVVEAGVWCKTIAVFWGGNEPVPEGVRFTFEEAIVDQAGLQVESGVCGTGGADRSCLGLTVEANESGIFCSVVLRPGEDFADGTTITFSGTLECPTTEVCDAVAAREVDPGPPLVVNTPEGA